MQLILDMFLTATMHHLVVMDDDEEPATPLSHTPHFLGQWLKHQGRSQRWLARQLSVDPMIVNKMVNGRRQMTIPERTQISRHLGISPVDLLRRPTAPRGLDDILSGASEDVRRDVIDYASFKMGARKSDDV